jgi:hypothetical protein
MMASNNYAEVITDRIEAEQVLAMFERLVTLGRTFKALEFNPDTDRFAISLERESNLPPYPEVEHCGETLDGQTAKAMWRSRDAVQAVSFGNGLLGLICECDGRHSMIIPAGTGSAYSTDNSQVPTSHTSQRCQFGFVLGGFDCDRAGTDTLRASWFYYPHPDWNVPLCPEHKSVVLSMTCERWLHDSSFKANKGAVDRSGNCGAPTAGLICWDCEGGHDYECDEIGCPGYELKPACARCLENPNRNDLNQRESENEERNLANVCETTITVVGLNDPAEIFVKALSKAMFGVDLDILNPKLWGEDETVDGKGWYNKLVDDYRRRHWSARDGILYPHEPYNKLGVTAPRFYVETKWGPPVEEIREASKSFPELTFHLGWWVEQDGPSGELVIRNGHDIDEISRPASWYLFDDAVLYPRISLLTAHLPYTLAQRASLRVQDAIDCIDGLRQILNDSRFTESPYEIERDPATVGRTKNTLDELLLQMKNSAELLTFEGVFLGSLPFRPQDQRSSPSQMLEENRLDIDEL